jgi:hypothetical protein
MATDSTEDDLLQTFLADVERLSISSADERMGNEGKQDAIDSDRSEAGDGAWQPNPTIVAGVERSGKHPPSSGAAAAAAASESASDRSKKGGMKGMMIANANANRRAWSEFNKIHHLSSGDGCGDGGEQGKETKVESFRIASSAKNSRKKNQSSNKATGEKQQRKDEGRDNQPDGKHGGSCSDARTTSASPPVINADYDLGIGCPRWTLIIDTCCLIEDNGAGVKNLINLATNANDARIRARQNRRTSALSALMTTIADEPIHIVIPAMVWSELDYQSKSKSSEATTAFAAREATRMLRDELESEVISNRGVVRSQSLLEARQAGDNYLPKDSKHTNDDHILVCAMTEYEAYKNDNEKLPCSVDAGGVVMVTLDGNLACKAISNGLKVYSPAEFQEYYQKRMYSLRRRAVGRLADSALRR